MTEHNSIYILGKIVDDEWCQSNLSHETQQDPVYKMNLTVGWETTTKYLFGLSLFKLIEMTFRTFLRTIDPIACQGATSNFDSIIKCLLGSRQLEFSQEERKAAEELLDLVRSLRNLIHNDGVFFAENGKDKAVIFNGTKFQFYNGKPVDFVSWDLLLVLANNIRQLILGVLLHPKIVSQRHISDPFMNNST